MRSLAQLLLHLATQTTTQIDPAAPNQLVTSHATGPIYIKTSGHPLLDPGGCVNAPFVIGQTVSRLVVIKGAVLHNHSGCVHVHGTTAHPGPIPLEDAIDDDRLLSYKCT